MKVLIIGFTKIAYMPYMHFYINQLIKCDSEIHLLCWNRDRLPDVDSPPGIETHVFSQFLLDSEPLVKKIPSFIKYRRYAKEILHANEYDLILVLHSTPAVLLNDILIKNFKGKYILDYRDFTYENFFTYKKIVDKLVRYSLVTFVSSKGYMGYLPNTDNVHLSHNLLMHSSKERNTRKKQDRNVKPIKIRFWGFIRHSDINKVIIDRIANDKRFELHYHGREQKSGEELKKYIHEKHINNVYFHGEYKPEDRIRFAADTDLIHNIYENDIKTINAMGNKYYDGINFYLPQICNVGSYMGNEAVKNGVGISLDPYSDNFADLVNDYYYSKDWDVFNNSCDKTINRITEEYDNGVSILQDIFTGRRNNNYV